MMSKLKEKFEIEKQELNAEKEKIQIFLKDSNKKYENQLKEMKMKVGQKRL